MKWKQMTVLMVFMLGVSLILAACGGGGGGSASHNTPGGASTVTAQSNVPEGDPHCPYGGVQLDYGIDDNANGVLDSSEIDGTEYICNGAPGGNGQTALINTTSLLAGDVNCPYGGYQVDSGLDMDSNGILDTTEITSTSYLCNGADAPVVADPLVATTVSASQIDLNWSAMAEDPSISFYKIYRDHSWLYSTADASSKSYQVAELQPSTVYCFMVMGMDSLLNVVVQSPEVCAATSGGPSMTGQPSFSPSTIAPGECTDVIVPVTSDVYQVGVGLVDKSGFEIANTMVDNPAGATSVNVNICPDPRATTGNWAPYVEVYDYWRDNYSIYYPPNTYGTSYSAVNYSVHTVTDSVNSTYADSGIPFSYGLNINGGEGVPAMTGQPEFYVTNSNIPTASIVPGQCVDVRVPVTSEAYEVGVTLMDASGNSIGSNSAQNTAGETNVTVGVCADAGAAEGDYYADILVNDSALTSSNRYKRDPIFSATNYTVRTHSGNSLYTSEDSGIPISWLGMGVPAMTGQPTFSAASITPGGCVDVTVPVTSGRYTVWVNLVDINGNWAGAGQVDNSLGATAVTVNVCTIIEVAAAGDYYAQVSVAGGEWYSHTKEYIYLPMYSTANYTVRATSDSGATITFADSGIPVNWWLNIQAGGGGDLPAMTGQPSFSAASIYPGECVDVTVPVTSNAYDVEVILVSKDGLVAGSNNVENPTGATSVTVSVCTDPAAVADGYSPYVVVKNNIDDITYRKSYHYDAALSTEHYIVTTGKWTGLSYSEGPDAVSGIPINWGLNIVAPVAEGSVASPVYLGSISNNSNIGYEGMVDKTTSYYSVDVSDTGSGCQAFGTFDSTDLVSIYVYDNSAFTAPTVFEVTNTDYSSLWFSSNGTYYIAVDGSPSVAGAGFTISSLAILCF